MQIDPRDSFHLTYCTNIHPGEDWASVEATIREVGPVLKKRLSPDQPFGLGLRLSALAARQAIAGNKIGPFRDFLDANGLYVAIINGYPFGEFHGAEVKDQVFAPDWSTEERLRYTLDLLTVLEGLLPDLIDGGISTMPLSYKPWQTGSPKWQLIVQHLVRLTEAMSRLHRDTAKLIHLDIEPEPDGLIENTSEVIAFFHDWLLPLGTPALASALNIPEAEARQTLLRHLRICFDSCHIAVEYENPAEALSRLHEAGIKIGRVQLSSALKVSLPNDTGRLRPFADSTYLHQVIEHRGTCLHHYPDLPQALAAPHEPSAQEWRIHFHVPLFTAVYDGFYSTQEDVREVLALAVRDGFTNHLEIETYTWDVLPADMKLEMLDSITREFEWVIAEVAAVRGR